MMEEEGGEGAEGAESGVDVAALEEEVEGLTANFVTAVVEFINTDPPDEGEPFTAKQQAVFRMKSGEDMLVAQEFIDKGGDIKRAIRIYNDALIVDPDNPDLQAALAAAEEARFMSPEKFAKVRKGCAGSTTTSAS